MRGANLPMDDATLLAYADGKLSSTESATVSQYLAHNPAKAEEVAQWRRQSEAISALFPPVEGEPLPARLRPHRIAAEATAKPGWLRMAAAATVLLAIGTGAGWLGHAALFPQESPGEALVETALAAHALYVMEARHAVEVGAGDQDHLVTWLSNRLETQIGAPDLSAQGFSLVGGRLLPPSPYTEAGPAAQLMYENATADRITAYITGAVKGESGQRRYATVNEVSTFYWADDEITCTVIGSLPAAQMEIVARQIYAQLTRHGSRPVSR